jgi:hypothetical protein
MGSVADAGAQTLETPTCRHSNVMSDMDRTEESSQMTMTSIAVRGGFAAYLLLIGLSACTLPERGDQTARASLGGGAEEGGSEAFWASFEQNCQMAGLQLVKLRLPSGYAMRCWRNYSACSNWVSRELRTSQPLIKPKEMQSRVEEACRQFSAG